LVLLADIEKALEKIEAVAQVVVLATQTENKRGQQIVAFCLLKQGATASGPDLRANSFDLLPRYAVPDEVLVVEAFPTLPSGKVDRQALTVMVSVPV
ncbi:MAG: long-chain fatty acid--CoA ligase, partial [Anaerolineae bacterium]|nr:long-chain fatty acid--CoA ligase [Anaerolineae bacterium]